MDTIQTIALTLGLGWASGLNLYAAVFVLGILGRTGSIDLPPSFDLLQHPAVITTAAVLYVVEFFADKIPAVDSLWDGVHTFIRIPAGAVLAAGAVGAVDPGIVLAAGLAGGSLAAASHAVKSGTRLTLNASPEPFSNWTASVIEDVLVVGGVYAAVNHPLLFLVFLAVFACFVAWLLPKIWRGIRKFAGLVRKGGGGGREPIP